MLERQRSPISRVAGRSHSNPCILNHGILQCCFEDVMMAMMTIVRSYDDMMPSLLM
jgi:hypothetical protein